MMEQTRRERLLGYVVLAGLIWIISHLALNLVNDRHSLLANYGHHNDIVYALMMVYMASLLLFDTLLWFAGSREANRVMKRYWAVSCILMAIWLLFRQPLMASESGGSILATFLVWLATPCAPMLPVSYLPLFRGLGMEWSLVEAWHGIIVLLLSTVHFFYFCWLSHRDAQRCILS